MSITVTSQPSWESWLANAMPISPAAAWMRDHVYGGMPIQLGWCNGHNTKLNCLEYHRDSEVNLGTEDFILLLAKEEEICGGLLDTACVKAFLCPAGTMVEVYATALHYAPCEAKPGQGLLHRGAHRLHLSWPRCQWPPNLKVHPTIAVCSYPFPFHPFECSCRIIFVYSGNYYTAFSVFFNCAA